MKRFLDVSVSSFALMLLFPLLFSVGILIASKMGRPIFFLQRRVGEGGRVFKLMKFRSMCDAISSSGEVVADADRINGLGRWLRSASVDELPSLWNVLVGDMSLVGPRPLLVDYLPLYSPHQSRRHEVRPGITGWAQVNGRNAIGWEQKFELDVWYVENRSLLLDLKILGLTVRKVLAREDINSSNEVSMPRFTGTK